jgi:hypothetical protein
MKQYLLFIIGMSFILALVCLIVIMFKKPKPKPKPKVALTSLDVTPPVCPVCPVCPSNTFMPDEGMPSSCKDTTSFQITAKNKLSDLVKNFLMCATAIPTFKCARANEILAVRDALKIFSFAYFPLKTGDIKYIQSLCDKNNKYKEIQIYTNDPVEVLLYYSSSIYTILGSLSDASEGDNAALKKCLQENQDDLEKNMADVFSKDIITGLSWQEYFDNPGPYGSTSGGGKPVTWAIHKPHDSKSPDTSLMLKPLKGRDTGGQFWGDVIPKQDSSTAKAIGQLIKTQTEECKKRYKNMKHTSKSKRWSDVITNTPDNIDIFHKFRKSIRTLGRTLETYSFEVNAMSTKIPDALKQKIKSVFGVTINSTYYKESLCIGSYNTKICTPDQIFAFLLFVDDKQMFDHSLWGLSSKDYNTLRAMVLMYTLRTGTKSKLYTGSYMDKSDIFCPSQTKGRYPTPSKESPGKFSDFKTIQPYIWVNPSIKNKMVYGSFCEIDDIMGDLHDVMVYFQQIFDQPLPGMQEYIKKSSHYLENFFDHIDINNIMDNISKSIC